MMGLQCHVRLAIILLQTEYKSPFEVNNDRDNNFDLLFLNCLHNPSNREREIYEEILKIIFSSYRGSLGVSMKTN